ncbi:MAG: hypothetical protein RR777_07340, partial [Christensenellaceae bacterium]
RTTNCVPLGTRTTDTAGLQASPTSWGAARQRRCESTAIQPTEICTAPKTIGILTARRRMRMSRRHMS